MESVIVISDVMCVVMRWWEYAVRDTREKTERHTGALSLTNTQYCKRSHMICIA